MKKEIENFILTTLNKVAILEEPNVAYEAVEILDYKTHFENGEVFRHQNGDCYALAILNAITLESSYLIAKAIKKTKNLNVKHLQDLIADHYLKCYISGNNKDYNQWKSGDLGTAYLDIDEVKKTITTGFINETAKTRV
ncbi:MAG: hypothetical protein ABF278_09280 [Wenyingzhuangia sp.]|uniref:hypothetical protein n=2 Tax=Wenyingzhuangia sp. TaxID=1964193 RepID=UPI00321C1648